MGRGRSSARRRSKANPIGVLQVHERGFGFVKTAEGEFFIPHAKMNGAFDGDTVELAPAGRSSASSRSDASDVAESSRRSAHRPSARILRVLERAHESIIGRYERLEPFGVVVPEDPRIFYDIFTQLKNDPLIEEGSLVRVRITTYPSRSTAATGVIEEVLGLPDDADVGIDLIIAKHRLKTDFPEAVEHELEALALDADAALREGYRDLRDRLVFTIDPDDAKDFDDALSCEWVTGVQPGGFEAAGKGAWRLGVHIADVSRYVHLGSSLDLEARDRTCSVYLPDRVLPMLPPKLSEDLCSLRPGVPRLTLTVDLYLDKGAHLLAYEIYPALICSRQRLSYPQVQEALEGCADQTLFSPEMLERINRLSALARKRVELREKAGGLQFEVPEAKVLLDAQGLPVAVRMREKDEATSLVEEAMILANEAVADYLDDCGPFGIYRVHDAPLPEELRSLAATFQEFSWFMEEDQAAFLAGSPFALQKVMRSCEGRLEENLIHALLLRSMKRAVYSAICRPHYGLAAGKYLHFTSPIRRYPDLAVHYALKCAFASSAGLLSSEGKREIAEVGRPFKELQVHLLWIAQHCSEQERVVEEASRDALTYKLIEYLQDYVGTRFSCTVSGVSSRGLFVSLENTAEGFIESSQLGDEAFVLDYSRHCLVGQSSRLEYRLGQRVQAKLIRADARCRVLAFSLC